MIVTTSNEQGQHVRVEREGPVAVIRLDRPKVNALSLEMLAELEAVAHGLREKPPGAVVVFGGERCFAGGAEIPELVDASSGPLLSPGFHRALDAVAAIPRVTIAAITGFALGGGLELALACDLRVVADNVRLGLPEVQLGIIPGGGGTERLPRLVGPARAKELILTGRHVLAEEALAIGLADRVVPAGDVYKTALELASGFSRGALLAQAAAKRAIDEGLELPLPAALALERELFEQVRQTRDAQIGVQSFLENGPGKAAFVGE